MPSPRIGSRSWNCWRRKRRSRWRTPALQRSPRREAKVRRLVESDIIGISSGMSKGASSRPTTHFSTCRDTVATTSSRPHALDGSDAPEWHDVTQVDRRAQDERALAAVREGVLSERRQPGAGADRHGDFRGRPRPGRRFRARFDRAQGGGAEPGEKVSGN